MNDFNRKPAWLRLCVLLLIGFVTIPSIANARNVSSFPNLENNVAASIFTASFGIPKFQIPIFAKHGVTASSAQNPSVLQSSSATLQSTSLNLPSLFTSQLSSFRLDSEKATLPNIVGSIGTTKGLIILILTCAVALSTLCMLCLAITVIRYLPMLKYAISKLCFPTLVDPSKRFSIGKSIPLHSPISRLETRCIKLLFGRVGQDL